MFPLYEGWNVPNLQNLEPPKLQKWHLDSPKLISRKIWMTEKYWNFHSYDVNSTANTSKQSWQPWKDTHSYDAAVLFVHPSRKIPKKFTFNPNDLEKKKKKTCISQQLPKLTQIQEEFYFDLTHYWWSVITSHFNLDIDLWEGDPWSLGILIGLVKSIVSKILCTKEWLGTFLEKKKIKMLKAT